MSSFADETLLWIHIKTNSDGFNLQYDLDWTVEFFKRNQLKLNVSKLKMMRYHRSGTNIDQNHSFNGETITQSHGIGVFGVILDEEMYRWE